MATRRSQPSRHARSCSFFGTPPYMQMTAAWHAGANLEASSAIWSASSRVGASTQAEGDTASLFHQPPGCSSVAGLGAGPPRACRRASAGSR